MRGAVAEGGWDVETGYNYPCQNNSRCRFRTFWNHGIVRFLFVVVCETKGIPDSWLSMV